MYLYGYAAQTLHTHLPHHITIQISIGFDVPRVIEGYTSIDTAALRWSEWWDLSTVQTPRIAAVESAPPLQLGYGYGFNSKALTNMPLALQASMLLGCTLPHPHRH